jgi:hypothetical protein
MDQSLQPLLTLLDRLPDAFGDIRTEVENALRVMDLARSLAVVGPRKVLDLVIRAVYDRCVNEPPGTRPLEGLTQRLVKDGHLPPVLEGYASLIRQHGNTGAHHAGKVLTPAHARDSLLALSPILEWYVQGPAPGTSAPLAPVPAPPAARPETTVAVVPKGLRSFDANDAEFFLDLLPGPRDRDGLPEGVRFWKHRVEARDELAFTVGVIYGPSGCGKSSLVKAGLLPRLARHVLSVYIEATADDTEARLHKGLRKRCPGLPGDLDLTGALAALRRGEGLGPGQKVFLVLDQFEQWLHARRGEENTQLSQALRQCDGEHVQAVVLVRDDFWMGLSRFLGDLHIELDQGQNTAKVDLFDSRHARAVLVAFGRAFKALSADLTRPQEAFLEQAVAGLAQDGRVISVRLALFAEMVKGRPWTPATLQEIGGTEGVGAAFLEETFGSRTASPRHRAHERAARAVLRALLPEQGTDIKGNMQSYGKLLEASGYGRVREDFENLLRHLDGELRLITPTEPPGTDSEYPEGQASGERYYQLTHDYLVPALREWLTRKQRETRRGRAELRLEGLTLWWNTRPSDRYLPKWWEWANIRLFTRNRNWTPPQRKMMRRAGRYHAVRGTLVMVAVAFLVLGGWWTFGELRARALVNTLLASKTDGVPEVVRELEPYRRWADPLLRERIKQDDLGAVARQHIALALLRIDPGQRDYLADRLLETDPQELRVLRDALAPHGEELRERWWAAARPPPGKEARRLRAAAGSRGPGRLRPRRRALGRRE